MNICYDIFAIDTENKTELPLYRVLLDIVSLWTIFNIGYYLVLPNFFYEISYNSSPIIIWAYYLICVVIIILFFREIYSKWFKIDSKLLIYGLLSLAFSTLLWMFVYIYSLFPITRGHLIAPYMDLILATPWYFLPKSIEIFIQQLLVTVLVIELQHNFHTLKNVMVGYALCFGAIHIILFFLNGSPMFYSTFMTIGAICSSLIFPYLILKVRGGFFYSYIIHFFFYILLASLFQVFPPPGSII